MVALKNIDNIKIGLVLSGGGAKGAYEAGVFKALKELEILDNVSVISGTSIGTVNALMLAMNDNEVINSSWRSLSYSRFIINEELERKNIINAIKSKVTGKEKILSEEELLKDSDRGLLSQRGIKDFIKEYVDIATVKKSNKTVYACAYNTTLGKPEYFKLNDYNDEEVMDIAIASCSIPYIFKPIHFRGFTYADGGINSPKYLIKNADNVPIQPLKEHDCDIIIVIHLSHRETVDKDQFDKGRIIEIYPSKPLETITGIGTLNLNHSVLQQRIELGYRDGLVVLAPIVIKLMKGEKIDSILRDIEEENEELLSKFKTTLK